MKGNRSWLTLGEAETRALARELTPEVAPHGTILLEGDLGAGKTVFARGVAEALGIDPGEVQSPTFILAREHRATNGEGRLLHLDLYRLGPGEVESAGLDEMLEEDGLKVVEWAERLPYRPPGALRLRLLRLDDNRRSIEEIGAETGEGMKRSRR